MCSLITKFSWKCESLIHRMNVADVSIRIFAGVERSAKVMRHIIRTKKQTPVAGFATKNSINYFTNNNLRDIIPL